jgi:hypothetical protein
MTSPPAAKPSAQSRSRGRLGRGARARVTPGRVWHTGTLTPPTVRHADAPPPLLLSCFASRAERSAAHGCASAVDARSAGGTCARARAAGALSPTHAVVRSGNFSRARHRQDIHTGSSTAMY